MMDFNITLLTPLFSRGAFEDSPEIRAPSIRGMLHWWFRALGGTPKEEGEVFGQVHKGAKASKVVVRIADIKLKNPPTDFPTLPHKTGGMAAPKKAFLPGTSFDLIISYRYGGLSDPLRQKFERALHAFLLMGTFGLRSTRAAGSFKWQSVQFPYPSSWQEYQRHCQNVVSEAPLQVGFLKETFYSSEEARKIISDTLGGREDTPSNRNELARLKYPLGKIGKAGERKTSPLRFRIVETTENGTPTIHAIAIWDNRTDITGNTFEHLKGLIGLLEKSRKPLGNYLKEAFHV